ncbi:MAG: GNAT family N-acetyltransferase [Chloroflexi bacterium]|nr:MAG: GNAT family N-acetyltransferase [Chloroflexota bacterium]MBL1195251.1 GNAT family N-acetyltransferase [Chloroflexota bacterium]NOH12537.1 GNAT family N-acetyltransferase [Chloroflexota bacterium]
MTDQVIDTQYIELTDVPDIEGLSFRMFRGEPDYQVMHNLINATKDADDIQRSETVEDIRRNYKYLNNCDPDKDMIFAEIDNEPVAYGRVWWEKEFEGPYTYSSFVFLVPEWRRKGIGTAMLRYQEKSMREIAEENNHPLDEARFYQTWADDPEEGKKALLSNAGYKPVRYFFEMTRPTKDPIPDAPLPEGLVVRPVREDEYRKVLDAENRAFEDHWGHTPLTEKDFESWQQEPKFNPALWKVAWDGDEIAGMVLNFVNEKENEEYERKRGWTEDISVQRPWRKRGVAKALIAQSIQMFREMGMDHTALGVDAENPSGALGLYEYMGYKTVKQMAVYRKEME